MNIQQMEYILAVDRFKNFTRAAEHCHVTQATLSGMIKKLEDEMGVTIFDRKTQPVVTTDVGRTILDEAAAIVNHAAILKEKAQSHQNIIEGTLRIGIIPTVSGTLLPRILKPLIKTYPRLRLDIKELTTRHIIEELRAGKLDAGILSSPLHEPDIEEDILYYETLMVYGDIQSKTKYILPENLRQQKIWLMEEGHCLRDQFVKLCALKAKQLNDVPFTFQPGTFDALIQLVDDFGGLTLLPELYYQELSASRKKKVSMFKKPIPVREVSLVYFRPYARKRLTDAVTVLIRERLQGKLLSDQYKKSELDIAELI